MSKPRGHYCRICQQYTANEKFSGCGHASHICKACAKRGNKPPDVKVEAPVFIDIDADDFSFNVDIDNFIFSSDTNEAKPKKKRKPSKEKLLRAEQKKKAKAFLSNILANGAISTVDIRNAAEKEGITTEALHKAKGSLGIRAVSTDNSSVWRLPVHKKASEINEITGGEKAK